MKVVKNAVLLIDYDLVTFSVNILCRQKKNKVLQLIRARCCKCCVLTVSTSTFSHHAHFLAQQNAKKAYPLSLCYITNWDGLDNMFYYTAESYTSYCVETLILNLIKKCWK